MKGIRVLLAISWVLIAPGVGAVFGLGDDAQDKKVVEEKTAKECEIPAFAKAIGHEDKWLLHNGCPARDVEQKSDEK